MTATALERVPLNPKLLASLQQRLGDRLSTSAAVCAQHGKDESYHAPHAPDAVAFAHSTEEVAEIVSLCAKHKTPVVAFGTGTSLEGHVAALRGGVCIDLSQMENVLSLIVVLADGRVIRTARRARKSAAGYDLTRLFVGSEGTLGVITEVTVRLYGIPEAISAAVCAFPTIAQAVDTVILTIQSGVPVARIELLDEAQIDAINKYSRLDHKVAPTLFFEFHGSGAGVADQVETVKAVAAEHGGDDFRWATSPEERSKLWQ